MENDAGILLRIHAAYNQLTKAEKKVATYVLEHTQEVLYMSITDLADACDVGETSVYRFCRTMKLDGYQEFKMQLSLSLAARQQMETGVDSAQTDDMADCVLKLSMKAIQETYLLLDREAINHVVGLIESARNVYFFGVGDSLLMAEEARNKFLRVTGKVQCIADPHLQSMAASLLSGDDLVFIFSYSGATKDSIHVAKQAKNAGAKIVCITHFMKSPLTAMTDEVLLCGAKESPLDGGSMAVKMGQLFLIDLLYQQYYKQNLALAKENKEKTSKSVVEKLY
jgi:DNA-binding MurR/RpiR family transcriptional regulator